jgi:pimeloyl-ACP methyl ester carboxylesterase
MTTLTTKTDRFSAAHAATRQFQATRAEHAPQAARLSLKAPPLTASTGFETGKSGGAAEARALRFPWPGHGSADKIGWIRDVKPGTTDATGEFNRLNELAQEGKDVLPKDANKYVYLAVGGLFSGAAPKEIYFDQNLDALKDAGLQTGRVPVKTDESVEHNAKIVRDAVLEAAKDGKQVVLIGHSKGGLDSAAALAMYPEIQDKVRALVTIQSPYGGSPIADDLLENPGLKAVLSAGVKALGGDPACGIDLTYEARQEFLAKHPMPPGIPVVSMASNRVSPFSPLFTTAEYMKQRYGIQSDGLVSPKDAFIPGSRTVMLQGIDHLDSTVDAVNPFLPYKPADLTLSLVGLALHTPKSSTLAQA